MPEGTHAVETEEKLFRFYYTRERQTDSQPDEGIIELKGSDPRALFCEWRNGKENADYKHIRITLLLCREVLWTEYKSS